MAQANSVQREPSMEEILASIRRIIEDSDTARKQVDEDEEMVAAFDGEPEPLSALEIDAFREDLRPAPETAPAGGASLAQFQAEAAREPRMEAVARESWPQPSAPEEPETVEQEDVFGDADFTAALDGVEEPAQAENQNPRPAILSDHAGRQVAAAFGELSEAFAASRRKSFDEMAEDMMRPMLQDWLDNNLPLLVERLVREEIERVARGGTR